MKWLFQVFYLIDNTNTFIITVINIIEAVSTIYDFINRNSPPRKLKIFNWMIHKH